MTTPPMTEKLTAEFAEQKRRATEDHGVDTIHDYEIHWRVAEEARPGRGHDLSWFTSDGEKVVQGTIDVYGHGSLSVGDVDWTHNDSDEECRCHPCQIAAVTERAAEGYYIAARDADDHIRLNSGRGVMVADRRDSRERVQEWRDRATEPRFIAQYDAALALLDREAADQ